MVNSEKIKKQSETVDSDDCDCDMELFFQNEKNMNRHAMGLKLDDPELIKQYTPDILNDDPPESWDWRDAEIDGVRGDWTTPIRDQGPCGSCWAFAALAAMETIYNIQEKDPDIDIDLSEQYMLSCGTQEYPFFLDGCCGGSLLFTLLFLEKYGAIPEECFPYTEIDCYGRKAFLCPLRLSYFKPVSCTDKCENWRDELIGIKGYNFLSDEKSIKNAIIQYGPIMSIMQVYLGFDDYNGGIYVPETITVGGNHLILIVGYNDTDKYWICKNSWGTDWGEDKDGYSWDYDNDGKKDHEGGWFRIKYGECSVGIPETVMYIKGVTTEKTTPEIKYSQKIFLKNLLMQIIKLPFFKNILGL
jgi:C1A family cysteine protease